MKNFTFIKQSLLLSLIVCIIFCWGCKYEYTRLLPPLGCSYAIPEDINNNGVLVGGMYDENDVRKGFIYEDGQYTKLLPPGWQSAQAIAINDNGIVLGDGYDNNGTESCFIYKNGEYTELMPPGFIFASADGINNNDVVVGRGVSGNTNGGKRGFIYENGAYTELLPPGWRSSITEDINNNDVVVGWLQGNLEEDPIDEDGNLEENDFIYVDGEYTMLLPPDWSDLNGPTPHAINDNKVIVGSGWDEDSTGASVDKGFIYEDGEYTELLPPGWKDAEAWDINNNGIVIGGLAPDGPSGLGGGINKRLYLREW